MQHSAMTSFLAELEAFKAERLVPIIAAGRRAGAGRGAATVTGSYATRPHIR